MGNRSTWWARPEEIEKTNQCRINLCKCMFSKQESFAEAFQGAEYFLAPNAEIDWIKAAIFSVMFYKRYIVDGVSLSNGFEYARKRTQTCTDYPNYWL
ncbi:MAG: hypothetical protein IAX21_00880 [Candidatus Bathyarchaeota archaeon]|nr:hypothetical protein [Candidatus Bathyarchaeum tardum]WGM90476.1 MAG: hypothetical protein NUK63_04965 [Candidatus Bathyarchaeum tardum]WNZ29456.1 MAG: hypothetical protein IAX21_00880 [Candidatus Bathyarchaeota archaeon]